MKNWIKENSNNKNIIDKFIKKNDVKEGADKSSIMQELQLDQLNKINGIFVNLLKKGGKNWIQDAVNPKHKGYCTPMTKSTCTPHRKALAKTFKKHHGFHKQDGGEMPKQGDTAAVYKKGSEINKKWIK